MGVLVGGAGAVASQLPGLSFFTSNAPPSFGLLSLMTSGITLAIFVRVLTTTSASHDRSRTGLVAISGAIVLALTYAGLLGWVTVSAPQETGVAQRFQIGFGLSSFSLTEEAKVLLQATPGGATPEDLMLMKGAFRPGGPQLLWKSWTITLAWSLLTAVFLLAYGLWSFGLACVGSRMVASRSG